MSAFSERLIQHQSCMLSMEEVMKYEVHGKPKPIRFRRTSKEYSRSFFDHWQKPLPFHSIFCKEPDMNADANITKRKCPLEAGEEHTVASSSSHECMNRPCACPDPGKSKEMCVIKKVENWLLGKCLDPVETEEMEVDTLDVLPSMPKWPPNVNKRPELEKYAVSSLPPSVVFRQIEGTIYPVYTLNVRVLGYDPQSELQFVRGHCPYYSCNSTITHINWAEAGPLTHGKLARPYCPECCQTRRKRYLNLFFHLELHVEDNLGNMVKLIISRNEAVRFFGLTVYRFLINSKRRQRVKEMLEDLLKASSAPRSAPVPGLTFDVRIMPVAVDGIQQVQFCMYGDNPPLFDLSRMCRS